MSVARIVDDGTVIGETSEKDTPGPDDQRLWSVTTLIGALDKPAIPAWTAIEVAKAALDGERVWRTLLEEEGHQAAIDWLKKAPYRRPRGQRSATQLGKDVHAAVEQYALTGRRPDVDAEIAPFVHQFERFADAYQPVYRAVEMTVYSQTYGYAGTTDGIITLEGADYVIDYKTSRDDHDSQGKLKGPYPEVGLQLAAYRHAELAAAFRARSTEVFRRRYYLLNDTERALAQPVPSVDGGLAIYLTPTRYAVHPVRCDAEIFEFYLHVTEAARYQFEIGKDVVGAALIPPTDWTGDPFAGLPKD